MTARVTAELSRLSRQPFVLLGALAVIAAAAYTARWSPILADGWERREYTVDISGALTLAARHLATGAGVALITLFIASGPGRDFVDGNAELQRISGSAGRRFAARVMSVTVALLVCWMVLTLVLIAGSYVVAQRNGYEFSIIAGPSLGLTVPAALPLVALHCVWILALAQRLQTQALQLLAPIALIFAMLMLSRLLPWSVTPDGWFGPFLQLDGRRALLDSWWSVGARIWWPWGNIALLAALTAIAAWVAIKTDRLPATR